MVRSTFIIYIIAGFLSGCSTFSSETSSNSSNQGDRQQGKWDLPPVQLPLFHVGLQGRPTQLKDWFVQDVSQSTLHW